MALVFCTIAPGHAQSTTEVSQFRLERLDDEILVSALLVFELPGAVEDALLKGIPMYFVTEAQILRERWYWYDKKVSTAERHMRLAFQPLTRRWRLNVSSGANREGNPGLVLNQSFDTLAQALATVKRLSRWKIADATDFDFSAKYRVDLQFRLDLSQLPRPFQIGAFGQADWEIGASINAPLSPDAMK
ncbi:MAG: DUF4390 domain-containing protein [Rhodoferax sp.]|nr:DUF4390 domain-containing protein [Rhodoferax sp.]MCF8210892.1 DUF4390 domain-containing protein [Rhodoferax sp.]